jgi:hypothetical protein
MGLRQEDRARPEVIAADFLRLEGFGVAHVGVADDRQVFAERLERAHAARRQIELTPDRRRRPHVLGQAERRASRRAMHHLDARQTRAAGGRSLGQQRSRRHHRVEEGKGDRRAHPAQHVATRKVASCQEHGCSFISRFPLRREPSGNPDSSPRRARTPRTCSARPRRRGRWCGPWACRNAPSAGRARMPSGSR